MRLCRLEIRHFRGIRALNWDVAGDLVAIVGPGDSGKSTVLDAIELALSSRWAVALTENDFHNCDVSSPVEVTCFVAELPDFLLSDRKFGLDLQGLSPSGEINDEPQPGDLFVLAVRFRFDSSFEPSWSVVNDRLPEEGKTISSADRRHFGISRLGTSPDKHLGWTQGSALAQLTDSESGLSAIVADAVRGMRESMRGVALPAFDAAIAKADAAAARFGVGPAGASLTAQLNVDSFDVRSPTLNLHSGDVPLTRAGLGTRRLIALALQHQTTAAGGIALIDEVEAGLEPFRLRHLLHELRKSAGQEHGQVILTTHSSIVVEELPATCLSVVRTSVGSPSRMTRVPSELQALARRNSESFFARRIVVCEGKTEVGLLRGLGDCWATRNGSPPSHKGVVFVGGGGSETQARTAGLRSLGFPCIVLADSDREIDPGGRLASEGVKVVRWADQTAIEERLFFDLPDDGVLQLLEIAVAELELESVESQIVSRIQDAQPGRQSVEELADVGMDRLRMAAGLAAKKNGWFKRTDIGELVGAVVGAHLEAIAAKDLGERLHEIEVWAYADDTT